MSELEELRTALRLFIGAAYPVDISINPRGHNWSEAYLDQAFAAALDALARSGQAASGSSQGARSDVQNGVGLGQPEAPTAAALPKGWDVIRKDDPLKTIIVIAPNGYSAVTTAVSRNPENVLRMLVEAIAAHPPARSGAESEDARDAARYRWLRSQSYPWGKTWFSLVALDVQVDAAIAASKPEAASQPDRSEGL